VRPSGDSVRPGRDDLLAFAFSVVIIAWAGLQLQAVPAEAKERDEDASLLLSRVAGAEDAPYRAVQMVAYYGRPQSNALLDVRSSAGGRFVRAESGADVTRLWSSDDVGAVAGTSGSLREIAPPLVRMRPSDVFTKYEVAVGKAEKLLGAELVPLTFTRRRDGDVAERWWVHRKSGVVYRRDIYDTDGEIVGMSTVIEMHWGDPGPGDPVEPDVDRTRQVRRSSSPDAPKRLDGGYRLWRCYTFEVPGQVDGRRAQQWVYSDGMHALSVFRTSGGLKAPDGFEAGEVNGARVYTGPGPGTWAWEGGGKSYLVVAEEAAIDAAKLTEPFPKGGPSVWARLGSVWSRLIGAIGGLFG
jgi:sigma-E factor negative regulatory protein RseB